MTPNHSQLPGIEPEMRAVIAADEIQRDQGDAAHIIEGAMLAALTDYRRAFARTLLDHGCDRAVLDAAMGLRNVRERLPVALLAPLAP